MSPDDAIPRPLDMLWQATAIIWVVLAGEGLALVLALAPGLPHERWIYFGLASFWIQWVSLLTLATMYLFRGRLGRTLPPLVAVVALGLALAYCWGVAGLIRWFLADTIPSVDWWTLALQVSGITLTVGVLGIAAFDNYWRGHLLILRAKQAELQALQARIRPHFLFNTLNTGAALVHERPGEAERLLLDLADLFRAALSGPREIPLAGELALARRYLEIEALRFGPRLRLSWDLPDPIPEVLVPTLSIQPLVENAIRHGVEPSGDGGRVDISVHLDPGAVRVVICNDLPATGPRPSTGHQVGLISSRERILALSQGRGRLDTEVVAGRYVATITLPRP